MQKLKEQAEAQSGVPFSAVEQARQANIYQTLGADRLSSLSTAFYERVYADEAWFRSLFANTTKEAATRNQKEFLAQQFGGPADYQQRKGPAVLLARHGPYAVDARAAPRWLEHMFGAMRDVGIDGDVGRLMQRYFQHMAWFIVFGRLLVNPGRTVGYFAKHVEGQA